MCYTIPGKVISIKDNRAEVDYNEEVREVDISFINAGVGDYVIVQAGIAISKVPEDEAKEAIELWDQA